MSQIPKMIFSGMKILHGSQWLENQALIVENKLIKAIIPNEMIIHHLPAQQFIFPNHHLLIPGLIDLHIHGTHGKDVMDAEEQSLRGIAHHLAQEGVTGFLATTMSVSAEKMLAALKMIAQVKDHEEGARLLGIHLEGPFISEHKVGAHQAQHLQLPDIELIKEWQHITKNSIKLVTLAPELPQALDFIRALSTLNIVASIGHSNATFDETQAAIDAGCTHATHLFNAMRTIHQRGPGPVPALLLSPKVVTELIADGIHLHPAILQLSLNLKRKEGIVLVTDAMRGKCLPQGQYDLGGQTVTVGENKAILADGTLAGSVLRMPQAIQNMVRFTDCTLADAIDMATINPAKVLGFTSRKGSIEVGKDADIVIMDEEFEVALTLREGLVIYQRQEV